MAHRLERLRGLIRSRPRWTVVAVVAALGLLLLWGNTCRRHAASGDAAGVELVHVVSRAPFALGSGYRGEIAPGDSVAIVAPFEGVVRRLAFAYGDPVEAGQVLAELDPADVKRVRNEAESAYLTAAQTAADLRAWQDGPEMSRARRGLSAATLELARTERRLEETRMLLDRGLVPRSEYEGLEQQLKIQQMSVESARDELTRTARRGEGVSRRVSALELANAADRLAALNADIAGARVTAPDTGIIVSPPASGPDGAESDIRVGTRVAKGQPLGVIARAGGLGVRFQLDESDVNSMTIGQPVTVVGAGFPGLTLTGKVASISGQAINSGGGSKATFVALAMLDPLDRDEARQVRIGMSAEITVARYSNPRAITLPTAAVQGSGPNTFVMVRDKAGGAPRKAAVRLGRVGPDRVEVLSGLAPGDRVVWTAPRRPPAAS